MNYENLDTIADAYIPLLLAIYLGGLIRILYLDWPNYRRSGLTLLFGSGSLLIAYGIMFLDNATGIWPSLGMDYSTHTAVAFALIFSISLLFPAKRLWLTGSLVAYILLMLYQRYHSLADILSTLLIVSLCLAVFYKLSKPAF